MWHPFRVLGPVAFAVMLPASMFLGTSQVDYITVKYCDLVDRPSEYDGKHVKLSASYRYGFESNEVYCVACRGELLTFGLYSQGAKVKEMKKAPKGSGTINATFSGVFRKRTDIGNGYTYQLDIDNITDVRVISKSYAVPERLEKSEKDRLCLK